MPACTPVRQGDTSIQDLSIPLFPPGFLTPVWSSLVGRLGPLPASPSPADTPELHYAGNNKAYCCKVSSINFLVLSILSKVERKNKAEFPPPPFVPWVSFQLYDVVQREVSIESPYRFFLLHKIRGFFSSFMGRFMFLLNAFIYKMMFLQLICLDSTQVWKPNYICLGNMITCRNTKMQSIVIPLKSYKWSYLAFCYFYPNNIIQKSPW